MRRCFEFGHCCRSGSRKSASFGRQIAHRESREDYAKLAENVRTKGLLSGILLERAKSWLAAHPKKVFRRRSILHSRFNRRQRAAGTQAHGAARAAATSRTVAGKLNLAPTPRPIAPRPKPNAPKPKLSEPSSKPKRPSGFLRLAQAAAVVFAAHGGVARAISGSMQMQRNSWPGRTSIWPSIKRHPDGNIHHRQLSSGPYLGGPAELPYRPGAKHRRPFAQRYQRSRRRKSKAVTLDEPSLSC